jgi:prolyl oligopeptidase
MQRGESYFFLKRLAGEQQFSIYVRHGLAAQQARRLRQGRGSQGWHGVGPSASGPGPAPHRPGAKLSRDPNTSVGIEDVSRDGSLLAYGVQQGGADEDQRACAEREDRQDAGG